MMPASTLFPRGSFFPPLALTLKLVNECPSHMAWALCKVLPLSWDSKWVNLCVCPLRAESGFPTALLLSWIQAPLVFKPRCCYGGLSSWCRSPGLGCLMWGSNPSLLRENLCVCEVPSHLWVAVLGVWVLMRPHLCPPTCLNVFFSLYP